MALASFSASSKAAAVRRQPRLDVPPIVLGDVADLQQAVDEQPQAGVGRQAPGADVRRAQQAQLGQVLHGVADRGRRQVHAAARQGARAHRLAGLQIGLHDPAEDVAGARVQLGKGWRRDPATWPRSGLVMDGPLEI